MRLHLATIAALALLSACSGGGDGANASDSRKDEKEGVEAGAGAGSTQEAVPANLQQDGQNQLVPISLPSPTVLSSFPADFQGRWGIVPADCEPARADAKGLMVVGPTTLTFYESRATIDSLRTGAPGGVTAELSFSGEGETWKRSTVFTLIDDGKTLTRQTQAPQENFRYTRCG